jgi:hypothetical protein
MERGRWRRGKKKIRDGKKRGGGTQVSVCKRGSGKASHHCRAYVLREWACEARRTVESEIALSEGLSHFKAFSFLFYLTLALWLSP